MWPTGGNADCVRLAGDLQIPRDRSSFGRRSQMILGRGGIRRYRVRGAARHRPTTGVRENSNARQRNRPTSAPPYTSALNDQREVIDHRGHASGFAREGDGAVVLGA
jgi:hypothetical protein